MVAQNGSQHFHLGFVDSALEGRYRLYIQPRVPLTICLIFLAWFLLVLFSDMFSWKAIGSGYYVGYALIVHLIVSGSCIVGQVAVHVLDRYHAVNRLTLLSLSDLFLFLVSFVTVVAEHAYVLRDWQVDCEGISYIIQQPGKVYNHHNCHSFLLPHAISMGFLMVLRRTRFRIVVGFTLLCFVHNVIISVVHDLAVHANEPKILYFNIVYNLAFLSFASAVRYQIESTERKYALVLAELEDRTETIQRRAEELQGYLYGVLPAGIVSRSSHSRLKKARDITSCGIAVVVTTSEIETALQHSTQIQVAASISRAFSHIAELAESEGLERIQTTEEELLLIGNLIDKREPRKCMISAAKTLLVGIDLTKRRLQLPLRACVSVGALEGYFSGSNWIHYCVDGESLRVARAGVQYANSYQTLLTAESVALASDRLTVSDGPTMAFGGEDAVLSSCDAVEEGEVIPSGRESTDEPPLLSGGFMEFEPALGEKATTESIEGMNSNNDSKTAAEPFDRYLALQKHAKEALASEGTEQFSLRPRWGVFFEFVDPEVESEFLKIRMKTTTTYAIPVWLAYAYLQGVLLVLLLADFWELHTSFAAFGLFIMAIALSVVMAAMPALSTADSMTKHHTMWSTLGLMVPLISAMAAGLARPSAIGNLPTPFAIAAAVVRAPCFIRARYQLVVIPPLLLLSQLHLLLPGGNGSNTLPLTWFLVLYCVITDSENDKIQRNHFIAMKRLVATIELLKEERRVRNGLVRSALPVPVVEAWNNGTLVEYSMANSVPDTLTVVVQVCPRGVGGGGSSSVTSLPSRQSSDSISTFDASSTTDGHESFWSAIEEAASSSGLVVVKMVGDTAVLSSSVCTGGELPPVWYSDEQAAERIVNVLLRLVDSENVRILADTDTSVQIVGGEPFPTFSFAGIVLSRLLALSSIGFGGKGLYMTERTLQVCKSQPFPELKEDPQPPVRVRGMGIMRMTKLSWTKPI